MARLVVFMIAYPLLCVLFFLAIRLAVPDAGEALSMAGFGYALIFLPGLVIAMMDFALERFAHGYRLFWAAVAGLCLLPAVIYLLVPASRFGHQEVLLFGGIGALSAICCWLLAGRTQRRSQRA